MYILSIWYQYFIQCMFKSLWGLLLFSSFKVSVNKWIFTFGFTKLKTSYYAYNNKMKQLVQNILNNNGPSRSNSEYLAYTEIVISVVLVSAYLTIIFFLQCLSLNNLFFVQKGSIVVSYGLWSITYILFPENRTLIINNKVKKGSRCLVINCKQKVVVCKIVYGNWKLTILLMNFILLKTPLYHV